jgi:iron complex outermembrane receptor protein
MAMTMPTSNGQVSQAVKLALLASSVPVMTMSQLAVAQDDEEQVQELEEITVTGSRIPARNLVSSSPVTTVNANEIAFQGVTRIEDLLNSLPQVAPTQQSSISNGATGTATVDLRGLTAVRTLVLVNGRRLPAGNPAGGGIATDLNTIPAAMIDRVEVLTGGASATYGSDAVAGVVNFITKSDFEGFSFDYQYSGYSHKNDNAEMQQINTDVGFTLPEQDVTDGYGYDYNAVLGINSGDGRGNVTAYATYRNIKPIIQGSRDYSNCALAGSAGSFECGGSSTLPEGRITDFGVLANAPCIMIPAPTPEDPNAMACNQIPAYDRATGIPTGELDDDGNLVTMPEPVLPWIGNTSGNGTLEWPSSFDYIVQGDQFVDRNGLLYNYAPPNYYQRPDERIIAGAIGNYAFSDSLEVFAEVNFMDDKTVAQIAPSGAFFVTTSLPCGNPLLSAQQFQLICGDFNLTTADTQTVFLGRRNVEGGFRQDTLRHSSNHIVVGARGDINDSWSYEAYANFGQSAFSQTYLNDLSTTRIKRALNVIDDGSGNAICASVVDGSDPNCVPWDIFTTGAVPVGRNTPTQNYLSVPLYATGEVTTVVVNGYVVGDMGNYGWQLPGADSGISLVGGFEQRQEDLIFTPDVGFQSGDGAGQGGPIKGVEGGFTVNELFFEAAVPLYDGGDFADSVNLNLGYRYSDYDTNQQTDTFKAAFDWAFTDTFRIRASFQRAVRAGNLRELFRPQAIGLFDLTVDPCATATPTATLAECMNSGVTAGQYGNIAESPAQQYNALFGGNPDLKPETSDTVSFGFLLTPSAVEGLIISADYYDITVEDAIKAVDPATILNKCLDTGDAIWCDKVKRNPLSGTLWIGQDQIVSTDQNIAELKREGVDLQVAYSFDVGNAGSMDLSLVGTYQIAADEVPLPGEDTIECVGGWDLNECGLPFPEWAHTFRATWETPWDVDISGYWRHLGSVDQRDGTTPFDSFDWLDLSGTWQATEVLMLRAGVNNIFDKEPPIAAVGAGYGNGNTFPGVYDARGRYWFVGLSVRL